MAKITDETLQEIYRNIDPNRVFPNSELKQSGKGWSNGKCPDPSHDDSNPSFGFNKNTGACNCFLSSCPVNDKGNKNIISLYKNLNNISSFREAVLDLANMAGVTVQYEDGTTHEDENHVSWTPEPFRECDLKRGEDRNMEIAYLPGIETGTTSQVIKTPYFLRKIIANTKIAVPDQVEEIVYHYERYHKVTRFQWADTTKRKGHNKHIIPSFYDHRKNEWVAGNKNGESIVKYPVYQLDGFVRSAGKWILGAEGEKCVDALINKGIPAITWQSYQWNEKDISEPLSMIKGTIKGMIFLTDNDTEGRAKAQKVQEAGESVGFPVIIVDIKDIWAEATESGDIADFLELSGIDGLGLIKIIKGEVARIQSAPRQKEPVLEKKVEKKAEKVELTESQICEYIIQEVTRIGEMDDNVMMSMSWDMLSDRLRKMGVVRTPKRLKEIYLETLSNKPFESLSFGEFAALETKDDGWLVENLIRAGSVTLLAADPKVGKSLLLYDVSYCLANGLSDWCGFKISKRAKVLIIQTDESLQDAKDRLIKRGLNKADGQIITSTANNLNANALKNKIINDGIDFVMIDSLISNTMGGGCTMNDIEFGSFMYKIKDVASETGASIVLVHHYNKSNQKNTMNKLAGGFFIGGSVSCALGLNLPSKGAQPNERILTVMGSRYHAHQQSWKLELECEESNSYSLIGECTPDGTDIETSVVEEVVSDGIISKIFNFLKGHAGKFFTSSEITDYLNLNQSTVRKYLSGFERFFNRQVTRLATGKRFMYGISDDKENLSMGGEHDENSSEKANVNDLCDNKGSQGSLGSLPKNNEQDDYTVTVSPSDPPSDPPVILKDHGSQHESLIDNSHLYPSINQKPLFKKGDVVLYKPDDAVCTITKVIIRDHFNRATKAVEYYFQYCIDTLGEKLQWINETSMIDEYCLEKV